MEKEEKIKDMVLDVKDACIDVVIKCDRILDGSEDPIEALNDMDFFGYFNDLKGILGKLGYARSQVWDNI